MALRFLTFCLMTLAFSLLMWGIEITCMHSSATADPAYECLPTAEDEMGPLYKPDAPLRNSVGKGYLLIGTVISANDCTVVSEAQIEVWLAGPEGLYGDEWRATLKSNDNGQYYFESHTPPDYGTGRAHIHIKVTAAGFKELITQHYPVKGTGMAEVDLVLIPRMR